MNNSRMLLAVTARFDGAAGGLPVAAPDGLQFDVEMDAESADERRHRQRRIRQEVGRCRGLADSAVVSALRRGCPPSLADLPAADVAHRGVTVIDRYKQQHFIFSLSGHFP